MAARPSRDEEQRAFDASVAAGATLFDTAEMYGAGASERRLGELAHGRDVLIATKFPPNMLSHGRTPCPGRSSGASSSSSGPTVDLYMHHYPSRWVSIPRLMNLMADAVEQGKVRAVGVSNYSADQMRLAHAVLAERGIPLASNQVEYSLLHRRPETDGVLDACRELGVTLIANQPLANGALTGKFVAGARPTGFRRFMPRFRGRNARRVDPVVALLREIGDAHGRSPAQVALRWLIENELVLPIPGAKNGRQAADNAGALAFSLTPAEIEALDRATAAWRDTKRSHVVKLGLQIYSFTWPGGPEAIGPTLARSVRTADEVGFDSIWVMDHFWQIGGPGSELQPMLEGWTTLGFMAANSQRARLGLMVGGVHYRNPGLWVKAATTLDVLSGGRAWLGIGAAWNQAESQGLGFPWPSTSERFEMLEDTLRIAHGMWQGERGSEEDVRRPPVPCTRLLNVPQSISGRACRSSSAVAARRRPFASSPSTPTPRTCSAGLSQLLPKYAILAEHCEAVGRDFTEIERTNMQGVGLGSGGRGARRPSRPTRSSSGSAGSPRRACSTSSSTSPRRTTRPLIELPGSSVLPQLRDVEAADPRTIAAIA